MNNYSKELSNLITICHSNLKSSEKCVKYLKEERGLSEKSIAKYKIGYFPQNIKTLLKYVPEEVLLSLSIMDSYGNSNFSDYHYLVFPIFSETGQPLGIGGRTLLSDQERDVLKLPKYRNSTLKKAQTFYGLEHSKYSILENDNVYVVEGYFDHIALDANNISNSVAICGTAFSKYHFLKLSRYTSQITFLLDNDDAGKVATERIESKFSNKGIRLRFKKLPSEYKDSHDYFSDFNHTAKTFDLDTENIVPGIW